MGVFKESVFNNAASCIAAKILFFFFLLLFEINVTRHIYVKSREVETRKKKEC